MFCTNCGKQLAEDALFCPNCGARNSTAPQPQAADPVQPQPFAAPVQPQPVAAPQQDAQQAWQAYQQPNYQQNYQPNYQQPYAAPVQAPKKKKGKGLLIGLGCLVLAALIAGGIWFLNSRRNDNPVEELSAPAERSLSELSDYVEELPNLHAITRNLEKLDSLDRMHLAVDVLQRTVMQYGEEDETSEYGMKLDINYDDDGEKLSVGGLYAMDGVNIPFDVYLDRDQLQLYSSALLEEGEAIMLPLKDLPRQWNESALGKMTGLELPEDLDLSGVSDADLEESLKERYGEDWTKFYESVDVVPYEGAPRFEGPGETLTLSYDREALRAMADKTDLDLDDVFELDFLDDVEGLSDLNLGEIGAQAVIAFLSELDQSIEELQFYTENDRLLGAYLAVEGGNYLELRLTGEENPWEHITVSVFTDCGSYSTTDTLDIRVIADTDTLKILVNSKHEDTDGAEYCYEDDCVVTYYDADGRITAEDGSGRSLVDAEIHLVPADDGFRFTVKQSDTSTYYSTEMEESFLISSPSGEVKPLSDAPIEILKLTEEELQALMERMERKAQQYGLD